MYSVGIDNYYVPEELPTPLAIAVQREQRDSAELQAVCRPGGKNVDLSQKATAEPRTPNEPHTANVASATAPPPGLRMTPVDRVESEKVDNVQVAPQSTQHARPEQAMDTEYGTSTGPLGRKKVGIGMSTVPAL